MKEIDQFRRKIHALANSGQYKKGYLLARGLRKKFPDEYVFAYAEAVMFGDDEDGRSASEIAKRHKIAAKMLAPWLKKIRAVPADRRGVLRNEYYWFSHQPRKQYRLGVDEVKAGKRRGGYYSQGVGAVEVSFKYLRTGKKTLAVRWAKRAETAWREFLKIDRNWYNSYCWYARSLGLQGRTKEMEKALARAAKVSGKSIQCEEFRAVRREVQALALGPSKNGR